jgi:hypothetical protein
MAANSNKFTKRLKIHASIFYYSLLCIAFTLPFSITLNSISIIVLILNWLVEGRFKEKFAGFWHNKLAILFICLYLLNLAGLIYTTDLSAGLSDTETKLSLLIFPLILSTSLPLRSAQVNSILGCFVFACVIGIIICISRAMYAWLINDETKYFFYHALSGGINMHAVYFALYLSFCIGVLIHLYYTKDYMLIIGKSFRIAVIILVPCIMAFILLLASKIVIGSVVMLANIFLIIFFIKRKHWQVLVYTLLLNLTIVAVSTGVPVIRDRLADSLNSEFDFIKKNEYDIYYTGVTLRVVFIKFTIEILNNTQSWLFGVGTGDGQFYLDEIYQQYGLYTGNPEFNDKGYLGYNVHNQYFQYLLSLGLIGLAAYLFTLAVPIMLAFRYHHYLYLFFLLLFAAGSVTESNLCTQKGVIFFAFFNSLFAFQFIHLPICLKKVHHLS